MSTKAKADCFNCAGSPPGKTPAPALKMASKLKWLMFARVVFTAFLLGSTIVLDCRQNDESQLLISILYLLIAVIFLLSLCYVLLSPTVKRQELFGHIQIAMDSFIVSLIVLSTGGFLSFFNFLYLVVIIYASMILFLRGGVLLAGLCTLQYWVLSLLQYGGSLPTIGSFGMPGAVAQDLPQVIYRLLINTVACFAVAILSGYLTEQNRRSQKELNAMADHLKRVEKLAYMGEMAAGLAHEIKNPLASLVGSIQLLKEESHYDSDQQRLMEIILRETDRLSFLVTDFLLFARPPAGRPELFNLKEALEEIIVLFQKDFDHGGRMTIDKQLLSNVWVYMDPAHLKQVIWNLLLNAAEAIEGDGRIEISTRVRRKGEICLQVSDTGCGITPDIRNSIFNPFFTTKNEGTGLGLSIVHRILETYDSRLDFSSTPGKGSQFSCIFKQAAPPLQKPARAPIRNALAV